jgi:hypothetical protein
MPMNFGDVPQDRDAVRAEDAGWFGAVEIDESAFELAKPQAWVAIRLAPHPPPAATAASHTSTAAPDPPQNNRKSGRPHAHPGCPDVVWSNPKTIAG